MSGRLFSAVASIFGQWNAFISFNNSKLTLKTFVSFLIGVISKMLLFYCR